MVFAGEAMIFVVDSDEAVGQCDDEDMRKLEALAANKSDEQELVLQQTVTEETDLELQPENHQESQENEILGDSNNEGTAHPNLISFQRFRKSESDHPDFYRLLGLD